MARGQKSEKLSGKSAGANRPGGTGNPGELERLERILQLMDRHEVAELEWEKSGERISLRTKSAFGGGHYVEPAHSNAGATHAAPRPAPVATAPAATPVVPAAAAKAEPAANQKQVVSPFVGTFYRAASPTGDPYVRDGQTVKRGDVLCIIEAMKLMNEIEAEFPGKILSCLVENGQPVEFGEPLFLVET